MILASWTTAPGHPGSEYLYWICLDKLDGVVLVTRRDCPLPFYLDLVVLNPPAVGGLEVAKQAKIVLNERLQD